MALKIVDSRMFLLCLRPKIKYVYNSVQSCTTVEVQKYRVLIKKERESKEIPIFAFIIIIKTVIYGCDK